MKIVNDCTDCPYNQGDTCMMLCVKIINNRPHRKQCPLDFERKRQCKLEKKKVEEPKKEENVTITKEKEPEIIKEKKKPEKKKEAYDYKENLEKLYASGMTQQQIANHYGIGVNTISKRFKAFGIKGRSLKEVYAMHKAAGKDWKRKKKERDYTKKYNQKDWIYEQYYVNNISLEKVAEMAGCSYATLKKRKNEFGIPTKIRTARRRK